MEHHSGIVPWQMLCEEKGAKLRVIPINDQGELLLEEYEKLLGPETKVVSVAHVSNALGTINPVGQIIEMAHRLLSELEVADAVTRIALDFGLMSQYTSFVAVDESELKDMVEPARPPRRMLLSSHPMR
jgi:cysteine desulfurase/selenocysteine lyase